MLTVYASVFKWLHLRFRIVYILLKTYRLSIMASKKYDVSVIF